jgi:actin-related protein
VNDWEAYEHVWQSIYDQQLRVPANEMPLLLCEPVHQSKEQREQIAQLAFEKFDVPALFLAKNSVLAASVLSRILCRLTCA